LSDFFAYSPQFFGGVRVAAGNVTGNGGPEIITGAGPGGGPHVRVFDAIAGTQISGPLGSFFAYDAGFLGGVFVSAAHLDGDNFAEVITSPDQGGGPHVKIFRGSDGSLIRDFFAFETSFTGGVRIAGSNVTDDGRWLIYASAGPGGEPRVRVFDGGQLAQGTPPQSAETANFAAFAPGFGGGSFIAGAAGNLESAMVMAFGEVFANPGELLDALI
jgi:hypothetical protein